MVGYDHAEKISLLVKKQRFLGGTSKILLTVINVLLKLCMQAFVITRSKHFIYIN